MNRILNLMGCMLMTMFFSFTQAIAEDKTLSVISASDLQTNIVNVQIDNLPLSVKATPDSGNFEVGEWVVWRATPRGGLPPYTYVWSGDATGTTQTIKKRYGITGIKNATLVTQDSLGQTVSDTASVQIIDSRIPQ